MSRDVVSEDVGAVSREASGPTSAPESRDSGADETDVAVSVLVPVTERPEDLADLYRTYAASLREAGWSYEFVFVFEPYYGELAEQLEPLARDGEPISLMEAGQTVGEASLVKWATEESRGEYVLTLPAYFRVEPEALPRLLEPVDAGEADLAVAYRWPREDPWINRLQTRAFHFLLRAVTGSRFRDLACGVRAMRRQVIQEVPLYGDFFRFFPLLAENQGFRVEEIEGGHHSRDQRPRVYSPGVYLRRLIDLLGVVFLVRFTYKPLRFFGLIGSGISLGGAVILAVLFVQRLGGEGIADRPMLLLGALLTTLGVQAVALGLIGEIIVHLNAPDRPGYRVLDVSDGAEEE